METLKTRLINLVALCSDFCVTIENASELEMPELVRSLLGYLPRIYFEFLDIEAEEDASIDEWGLSIATSSSSLNEDQYEMVRRQLASIFGEDDTYLETFEKDMKYSETPIAVSISENLADIYQPLFNFVVEVRESEGGNIEDAYRECKEQFDEYWSQTLCNAMRALNYLLQSSR
ncbi:MAG: DUF5063 domain-containing protein [Muribaculum sp.]|nr:DUF5063 domain-containing protein [Muribaculum sp.]